MPQLQALTRGNGRITPTKEQSMTIRCALDSFHRTLKSGGLGDDEHGNQWSKATVKALNLSVN